MTKIVMACLAFVFTFEAYAAKSNPVVCVSYLAGQPVHHDHPRQNLNANEVRDLDLTPLAENLKPNLYTSIGKARLDYLLAHPELDRDTIVALQDAVRELATNDELYDSIKAVLGAIQTFEMRTKGWEVAYNKALVRLGRTRFLRNIEKTFALKARPSDVAFKKFNEGEGTVEFAFRSMVSILPLGFFALPVLNHFLRGGAMPVVLAGSMYLQFGLRNAATQKQTRAKLGALMSIARAVTKSMQALDGAQSPFLRSLASSVRGIKARKNAQLIPGSVPVNLSLDLLFVSNLLLYRSTNQAYRELDQYAYLSSVLAELDILVLFARWARERPEMIYPQINPAAKPSIKMIDAQNPLLNARGIVPAPISVDLQTGESSDGTQIMFISGPNGMGKTTAVRTVAQNQILTQLGAPILATSAVTTPVRFVSSIKSEDSTADDESRFRAAVRQLVGVFKEIEQNPGRYLVLIDELFSSTNHEEKLALEEAILRGFQHRGALLISASHSSTLSRLEGMVPGFRNFQVGHTIENMFRLLPGASRVRNAIKMAREEGLPEDVIADAYRFYAGPDELAR